MPHQQRQLDCEPQPEQLEQCREHVRAPFGVAFLRILRTDLRSYRLYIDQPVGVGFSHGTTSVGTSQQAASDVWNVGLRAAVTTAFVADATVVQFLQIFFADSRFSKFQKNEFAIWTESYGGHYGPTFAASVLLHVLLRQLN